MRSIITLSHRKEYFPFTDWRRMVLTAKIPMEISVHLSIGWSNTLPYPLYYLAVLSSSLLYYPTWQSLDDTSGSH